MKKEKKLILKKIRMITSWVGKQLTFTKIFLSVLIFKSVGWVDQSYALAWAGKDQIAEALSKVVVTEVIAIAVAAFIKFTILGLSEHNKWPDKPNECCDATTITPAEPHLEVDESIDAN